MPAHVISEEVAVSPTGILRPLHVDVDGNLLVSVAAVATGAATAAKQDTGNTSLASLDTKQPAKGTAAMAASSPVTIATDDVLMAAIKADVDKIPSKGTAIMTGATPVTIATDDTLMAAMKTDLDKIPSKGTAVMTGAAPVTIATDDTLMAAIKADVDKIPSKGTAAMAGSTPVTIATDDTVFLGNRDATNSVDKIVQPLLSNATYSSSKAYQAASQANTVSSGAGATIYGFCVTNRNAAVRYAQFYANSGATGNAILSFQIPLSGQLIIGRDVLGPNGYFIATAVYLYVSTVAATYSAPTAGEHDSIVFYK